MTKKKKPIRYSELGPVQGHGQSETEAVSAPKPEPAPPLTPEPVVAARPRRNSSPVELAHALAAARAAELAAAKEAAGWGPEVVADDEIDPSTLAGAGRGTLRSRGEVEQLLMFRIGHERFAVELLAVEEVIDLPVIHHVPEMPPAMLGVVTVRGFLTPVYSPHTALGVPLLTKEAVLIFRRGRARVGILIDDVEDAVPIDLSELRSAPSEQEIDSVVLGVVRHFGVLVAIVDADALIAACQAATLLEIA